MLICISPMKWDVAVTVINTYNYKKDDSLENMSKHQFILVEPVAKTPFPPLGLMKISTMLKKKYNDCAIFSQVGNAIPVGCQSPEEIFITSLFTWDVDSVIKSIHFYQDRFPQSHIQVGGIAASLVPDVIKNATGIVPHVGLYDDAENCAPDYSQNFGRKLEASITYTSRGCPWSCKFCSVKDHEPVFYSRDNWEQDIKEDYPKIIFWDNNWLASPRFKEDCKKIRQFGKKVDFNQGLDARFYTEKVAKELATINIEPLRFAFDDLKKEKAVIKAIQLAKKYSNKDVRVYVLYNFEDSPEDFYYRVDLLNRNGILSFPMEYRQATYTKKRFPGSSWNTSLLRALKLSLLFYYRKGMITESRESFLSIYGKNPSEFVEKLYTIYEYDKSLKRPKN